MSNSSDGISGGKTFEVKEPFLCNIVDELEIDLKDAFLTRTITYIGQALDKPTEFTLPEINYSQYWIDFRCFKNGQLVNHNERVINYNTIVTIPSDVEETNSLSVVLKKNENLKIQIKCRWKNFYNNFSDFSFHFSFIHKATYELKITGYNFEERLLLLLSSKDGQKWAPINLYKDYVVAKDTIIIPGQVAAQNQFYIRIISPPTPQSLPILNTLIKRRREEEGKIFSNYIIILIQHLLGDFIHLINVLEQYGAQKHSILISGIPYSTKDTTVEFLRNIGYKENLFTPTDYENFYESGSKDLIKKAVDLCKSQQKEGIIVIEDGGYIYPKLHSDKEFKSDINLFKLVVEQTTNGITRANDLKKGNRKGNVFKVPLINVANSKIKSTFEAPLIGNAIVNNLELLLAKQYTGIKGKKIGLVGGGTIGDEVIRRLKSREAIVTSYDELETKNYKLTLKGEHIADSIIDLVKDKDIIIECSGAIKPWCNKKEIDKVSHSTYFINASSKRLGINHSDLEDLTKEKKNLLGFGKKYILDDDKNKVIILVADGYPINFFIGESVPDYQIQFIIATLFFAAKVGVEKIKKLKKEIIDMNDAKDPYGFLSIQNLIEENLKYLPN